MRERSLSVPTPAIWADALLTTDAEALLGAVRNYLGPVKTPYDKRDLVKRLESFLRRSDTAESLLLLLDRLDARILGSCLLLGPSPEPAVKELFAGELALFELGVRISNLLDRLLLFRYVADGKKVIAVNPLVEATLRATILDPALLFGTPEHLSRDEAPQGQSGPCDAGTCVAFFSFLFHSPGALRKGGGLTKRALERVVPLFAGLGAGSTDRAEALAKALYASGAIRHEESEWAADRGAFASMLEECGENLPFFLAASLTEFDSQAEDEEREGSAGPSATRERIDVLASLLAASLASPAVGSMSRSGMARWLRICCRRAGYQGDASLAMPALEALGLLGGLKGASAADAGEGAQAPLAEGEARAMLVAEGAHALHLMPEASLEDRLTIGCIARPVSLGRVWSFDLERDTARRAFASGLDAAALESRLAQMAGRVLPQSLAFSINAWQEEYRSLRLYRGLFLVADERMRPIIERGVALGSLVAELIAPGVYFLATNSPEEVGAVLTRAGLEAPPPVAPPIGASLGLSLPLSGREAGDGPSRRLRDGNTGIVAELSRVAGLSPEGYRGEGRDGSFLDPAPRLEALRSALERLAGDRAPESRRELADRIERRLVLSERQIAESDPRPERLEATGLDYMGKVRVVESALRSRGDRLEVLYRLPGEEPVRALLRPVKLEKNDKGLVLEAEDLATGGPARVPLGAVSTVRRVRASLFGDES